MWHSSILLFFSFIWNGSFEKVPQIDCEWSRLFTDTSLMCPSVAGSGGWGKVSQVWLGVTAGEGEDRLPLVSLVWNLHRHNLAQQITGVACFICWTRMHQILVAQSVWIPRILPACCYLHN